MATGSVRESGRGLGPLPVKQEESSPSAPARKINITFKNESGAIVGQKTVGGGGANMSPVSSLDKAKARDPGGFERARQADNQFGRATGLGANAAGQLANSPYSYQSRFARGESFDAQNYQTAQGTGAKTIRAADYDRQMDAKQAGGTPTRVGSSFAGVGAAAPVVNLPQSREAGRFMSGVEPEVPSFERSTAVPFGVGPYDNLTPVQRKALDEAAAFERMPVISQLKDFGGAVGNAFDEYGGKPSVGYNPNPLMQIPFVSEVSSGIAKGLIEGGIMLPEFAGKSAIAASNIAGGALQGRDIPVLPGVSFTMPRYETEEEQARTFGEGAVGSREAVLDIYSDKDASGGRTFNPVKTAVFVGSSAIIAGAGAVGARAPGARGASLPKGTRAPSTPFEIRIPEIQLKPRNVRTKTVRSGEFKVSEQARIGETSVSRGSGKVRVESRADYLPDFVPEGIRGRFARTKTAEVDITLPEVFSETIQPRGVKARRGGGYVQEGKAAGTVEVSTRQPLSQGQFRQSEIGAFERLQPGRQTPRTPIGEPPVTGRVNVPPTEGSLFADLGNVNLPVDYFRQGARQTGTFRSRIGTEVAGRRLFEGRADIGGRSSYSRGFSRQIADIGDTALTQMRTPRSRSIVEFERLVPERVAKTEMTGQPKAAPKGSDFIDLTKATERDLMLEPPGRAPRGPSRLKFAEPEPFVEIPSQSPKGFSDIVGSPGKKANVRSGSDFAAQLQPRRGRGSTGEVSVGEGVFQLERPSMISERAPSAGRMFDVEGLFKAGERAGRKEVGTFEPIRIGGQRFNLGFKMPKVAPAVAFGSAFGSAFSSRQGGRQILNPFQPTKQNIGEFTSISTITGVGTPFAVTETQITDQPPIFQTQTPQPPVLTEMTVFPGLTLPPFGGGFFGGLPGSGGAGGRAGRKSRRKLSGRLSNLLGF